MRVLFLDDSYQREKKYLGYGGFWIEGTNIRSLTRDLRELKSKFDIPPDVNLKWSPEPDHYLRTEFTGKRHDLYQDAISLLDKYNARVICAVHDLGDCYGIRLYNWDFKRFRQ